MGVKVVDGRNIKFRPISDYIEGIEKSNQHDKWGMVFTSKDNANLSVMIERLHEGFANEVTYDTD
ncbi:hypothetical protein ACFLVS_05525, partial [Chloroflexota bacterium]